MEHHHGHDHAPAGAAKRPDAEPPGPTHGMHGMLVLGGQPLAAGGRAPVYVSHLPMFMAPHNVQAILRIKGEAADRLGSSVGESGAGDIHTLEPELFELDDLDPSLGATRTSFHGTLYRGHFERGGKPIGQHLAVEVEQVVHFRRFAADGTAARGQLTYLCFGDGDAAYLAHVITTPPDFDQVLHVDVASLSDLSDDDLRGGLTLTMPDRTNHVDDRLRAGDTFSGPAVAAGSTASGTIELTVKDEYYLETGDVAAVH